MKSYLILIKNHWRLLFFGFVMTFFSSPGQTYFISLFSGDIRHELSLSHGEFGAVYSSATHCSALLLLWTGSLIDRIDLRKFAIGLVIAITFACLLLSASHHIAMLFLGIIALRQIGQGLMTMSSSTAMMRYISADKSKANSLAGMGYSMAEAITPSIIILLLVSFNWRETWVLIAALLITCMPLLILFSLKEYPLIHNNYLKKFSIADHKTNTKENYSTQKQWTRKEVIRDPFLYLFIPGLVSQSMLFTGFIFHQIHLIDVKGWSLPFWGSLFIVFSLTVIITNLIVGSLSDKFGAIKLVPYSGLGGAIGLLILASSNSQTVAIVFMLLMAISSGSQAALTSPFLVERYGHKHFGSIKSLGVFAMILMSAVSPVMMGWLIDQGVHIDTLALSFSLYAFTMSGLAFIAYMFTVKASHY